MTNIPDLVESAKTRPCPQCGQGGKCIQLADGSGGICLADAGTGHIDCWSDDPALLMMLAEASLLAAERHGEQPHKTRGPTRRDKLRAWWRGKKLRRQGKESSSKDANHDH